MSEPTETEIIDVVQSKPDGMTAFDLFKALIDRGHSQQGVQNALQRALDKGVIKAGAGFVLTTDPEKAKAFA